MQTVAVASLLALAVLPLGTQAQGISYADQTLMSALANGGAQGFSCSNCSLVQMQSLAAAKGRGAWFVYNLPLNVINEYDVTCEPTFRGLVCDAEQGAVPSAIAKYFATYHGLWIQNGRNEAFKTVTSINFPSAANGGPLNLQGMHIDDGYINAYGTLQIGALDQAVIGALDNPGNYTGFFADLAQLLSQFDIPLIKLDKMEATVTVVFHDTSKRSYQYDKQKGTYVPVDNSAIDSAGNLIPEKSPRNGAIYWGDPAHPYNLPNILTILNARDPTLADESCVEEVWKANPLGGGGGTLTCVQAR